ncbi:FG-GAP repeat domain-containing protein [Parafrankia elaeagni]|uniref:FG-GAP repeat domain-containing protein n=1 Tax=Parafrankia elaeagni TaxID=222534 RepID=UPI0003A2056E|nr:VCBS repeat-containing protein [Parafrankia elaeagni]
MNGGLEPEELTRLLRAAVEPVRASPDALHRIRAGVEHRAWWRVPLAATGGVAMAALIVLAFMAIRPQSSSSEQTVEPAAPPLVASVIPESSRPVASSSPDRGGTGSGGQGSGGTTPRTTTAPPATTTPSTPATPGTSTPSASATTGPGGSGSLDLPSPVNRPAGVNDLDGDGAPDQVRINGTKVEVVFSRGGSDSVDLAGLQLPASYAVVDANVDGFADILVRTASRDGVADYTLLRYAARGDLAQATLAPGLRLAAGSTGTSGSGFRCDENGLRIIAGTSSDGAEFQIVTTAVQITPDGVVPTGAPVPGQLTVTSANSPFIAACGTFS